MEYKVNLLAGVSSGRLHCVAEVLQPGQPCLTAEDRVNLQAGVSSGGLHCVAEVLQAGRNLTVVDAEVRGVVGDRRTLVAWARPPAPISRSRRRRRPDTTGATGSRRRLTGQIRPSRSAVRPCGPSTH